MTGATETFDIATPDDIPALVGLLEMLFGLESEFTPDADKQGRALGLIIGSPQVGTVFVARAGGRVIGTMCLLASVSTATGDRAAWLEDVIVHPDHRGDGLGSRLLTRVIAWARAEGYARISLLTDAENAGAIRFYERHGFALGRSVPLRLYL